MPRIHNRDNRPLDIQIPGNPIRIPAMGTETLTLEEMAAVKSARGEYEFLTGGGWLNVDDEWNPALPILRWEPKRFDSDPTILRISGTSNFNPKSQSWTNVGTNGRPGGPRTFDPEENVIILGATAARNASSTLQIEGGKHVRLIGGVNKGRALFLGQASVYVEGVIFDMDGVSADCIAFNGQGRRPEVLIQNCLMTKVQGTSGGEHADIIQQQGDCGEVRVDMLTGDTNYQGLFVKGSAAVSGVHVSRWNTTWNGITPRTTGTHQIFIRALESEAGVPTPRFPVTYEEVYVGRYEGSPDENPWPAAYPDNSLNCQGYVGGKPAIPGATMKWKRDTGIRGAVKIGPPPGGDFVAAASIGLNYTAKTEWQTRRRG